MVGLYPPDSAHAFVGFCVLYKLDNEHLPLVNAFIISKFLPTCLKSLEYSHSAASLKYVGIPTRQLLTLFLDLRLILGIDKCRLELASPRALFGLLTISILCISVGDPQPSLINL